MSPQESAPGRKPNITIAVDESSVDAAGDEGGTPADPMEDDKRHSVKTDCTSIAVEFDALDDKGGRLPCSTPHSQIAGRTSTGSSCSRSSKTLNLPHHLAHLLTVECNPDRNDERMLRQGFLNGAAADEVGTPYKGARFSMRRREQGRLQKSPTRRLVGRIVNSWPVQTLCVIAILVDCVLMIIEWSQEPGAAFAAFREVGDWLVIIVLSGEVFGRIYALGNAFFKTTINIFEFVLVPVTIVEIFVLRHVELPVQFLRVLRPMARGARLVRIVVRIAGKGHAYRRLLRHRVSGDRVRFDEAHFDLDLAYITPQLIAMALPGVGFEKMYLNPLPEVARFMNERHFNKYLIINTTESRRYPLEPFFYRYLHFPIPQNGVPTLDGLRSLCKTIYEFLQADESHVVAVHSKHNQGRVGLIIAAYLLYADVFNSVAATLAYIEEQRILPDKAANTSTQTLDCRSQERFLEYFAAECFAAHGSGTDIGTTKLREAKLQKLTVHGFPDVEYFDVRCYPHPGSSMIPPLICSDESGKPVRGDGGRQASTVDEDNELWGHMEADRSEYVEALSSSNQTLMDRVLQLVEECKFDSRQAGSQPETGDGLLSLRLDIASNTGLAVEREQPASSVKSKKSSATWDLKDIPMTGEIIFEIHRCFPRATVVEKRPKKDVKTATWHICQGATKWFRKNTKLISDCCKRKKNIPLVQPKQHEGMLFSCWLHTSFLEYAEPLVHDDDETTITVVLHRFDFDKAAGAPTLRSLSSALEITLDFKVSERLDLRNPRMHRLKDGKNVQQESPRVCSNLQSTETYSLGWLTWAVKHMWPYARVPLETLLRESIEQPLQELLPSPLNAIHFKEFSLGDTPPELGPVSACTCNQEGFEIQLDIWVHIASDVNVVLDAGFAEFGINHLEIHGLLSIKLKPIVAALPVVEGIQLFFLNPPDLDLRFSAGLGVANFSYIKKAIMDAAKNAVSDIIVLPNILVIDWSGNVQESTVVTFKDILPHSVVRLGVVQARDLPSVRIESMFFVRVPDPVVTVQIGNQKLETEAILEAKNPFWGEEFDFLVHNQQQCLSLVVHDSGIGGSELGYVSGLSIESVVAAGEEGLWVPLTTPEGENHGVICLTATMYDLFTDGAAVLATINEQRLALPPITVSAEPIVSEHQEWNSTHNTTCCGTGNQVPFQLQRTYTQSQLDAIDACGMAASTNTGQASSQMQPPWSPFGFKNWCSGGLNGLKNLGGLRPKRTKSNLRNHSEMPINASPPPPAVLVCELFGGHVPPKVGAPGAVTVRIRVGSSAGSRQCSEADNASMARLSDEVEGVVERLARAGWGAERIASVIEEEVSPERTVLVQRIMRRRMGWNLELLQRIATPVQLSDIADAKEITVEVVVKGRVVAVGYVDIDNVLKENVTKHREIVYCKAIHQEENHTVSLDVECRFYSLQARSRAAGEESQTGESKDGKTQVRVEL